MIVVVMSNALWVYLMKRNETYLESDRFIKAKSKIFRYAFISSTLFVVTTLPGTIYFMLPPPAGWEKTCDSCNDKFRMADNLIVLMVSCCCFDNLLYYATCEQYRHDLHWGLRKVVACQSPRSNFQPGNVLESVTKSMVSDTRSH